MSLGNSYVQSNILGALGISQLGKLDSFNLRRKEIADYYYNELQGIEEIILPKIDDIRIRNWHLFYMLVKPENRLWLIDALKAEGIGSNVHYNPLHMNKYYEHLGKGRDLKNSEKFYGMLVRIPIYPTLSDNEAGLIVNAVKKVFDIESMVKHILIFGGGENQLTLIKAAKKLGVKSVVIDPKADAPGKNIADHFEVVGPSDYEHTRKIALKYKVDGIVTGQMENPLMLMARLAEDLGYIFPSREVIRHCRNKYMMKQAFIRHNIRCAKGLLLQENEKLPRNYLK